MADDADAIQYRQHVMTMISEQSGAIGQILATLIPDDNAVAHIELIAMGAAAAVKAFEKKVPGGDSKPEVWAQWDDFSKRLNDFANKSATALEIARTKGKAEGLASIALAMECKACHDRYRAN